MRTATIYICEICGFESRVAQDIAECEADCLGLTLEELYEYSVLRKATKMCMGALSSAQSPGLLQKADDVIEAELAFEKKHGLKDYKKVK